MAESTCPHCSHARSRHVRGKGCESGWAYLPDGAVKATGCICTTTFPPPYCFGCRQVGIEHCPKHRHAAQPSTEGVPA